MKIVVLYAMAISLRPFSLVVVRPSDGDANVRKYNESFVYEICSMVLEETEWKYISILTLQTAEMELSDDFMKNFHAQVCPIALANVAAKLPSSRATLLVHGNNENLFDLISQSPSIWAPDTFYVILVDEFPANGEDIFKDLWRCHHVTNVLLIALHQPGIVQSYNPFFDRLVEDRIRGPSNANDNVTANNVRKMTREKMSNLNGHPIRVTMFPTRRKAVPQPDGTFAGYDGIILQTLAKQMNFTPIIIPPPDGHKYGWKEQNGTFTGAMGEIVNGKADIAFNGVFIKHYHSDKLQFTTPVNFDQVCFVVPKALTKPKWKTVLLTFDLSIWLCVVISYWIALIAWYSIKKLSEPHFDSALLTLNLYAIFLMMPVNRIHSTWSQRTILLTTVLFAFVVANSFQGSMIKFLTYETYEQDMRTIAELAESKLPIVTASLNLKELFETDENPVMSKMLANFLWTEHKDILGEMAEKRNAASIGRKSDMEEKIAASYVKNNQIMLHIVEECPRTYHIAYLVPKKSPYLVTFNDVINYFIEAGITNSWFIHSKPFRSLSDHHSSTRHSHVVFTFENVRIAFMILVAGLTLSGFVLAGELTIVELPKKFKKAAEIVRNQSAIVGTDTVS